MVEVRVWLALVEQGMKKGIEKGIVAGENWVNSHTCKPCAHYPYWSTC